VEAARGLGDKAQTQSVMPRPAECEGRTLLGSDRSIFGSPAVVVCLLAHIDVFFLRMFVAEHTCIVVFRMVSDWMSLLAIEMNKMCQSVFMSSSNTTPYRWSDRHALSLRAPALKPGCNDLRKAAR